MGRLIERLSSPFESYDSVILTFPSTRSFVARIGETSEATDYYYYYFEAEKYRREPIAPRTDPKNHNRWLKSNSALQCQQGGGGVDVASLLKQQQISMITERRKL